jgi:hypothetical protein
MLKHIPMFILCVLALLACSDTAKNKEASTNSQDEIIQVSHTSATRTKFRGALTGGYKGDSIFFEVSEDGSRVENLAFKGHWRCSGKIESLPIAGPEGFLPIIDGKVDDHISDPPDGGSTAWRFDLKAVFNGKKAEGKFRMNINALDCNTGMLSFVAEAY